MVDMAFYWPIVGGIGISTFLVRASFILFSGERRLPDACLSALRFISPAVLAALAVPAIVFQNGGMGFVDSFEKPVAALLAVFVAWKTKNTLATIGIGMVAFWLIRWAVD